MNVQNILRPKQQEALRMLCRPSMHKSLYGGGRSGKTMIILIYLILICMRPSSKSNQKFSRHLVVRKYLSDLIRSVWLETLPKALKLLQIPPDAYKMNSNQYYIKFANGSEIWFGGMESDRVKDKVLGKEYTNIWINEASEFAEDVIQELRSRFADKSGYMPKLIFDFNPPMTTHWSYELIFNQLLNGVKVDIESMRLNPEDNLPNINPAYIKILQSMPERQRKRFLLGEFCSPDESLFRPEDILWMPQLPRFFKKVIIGVDPAVTADKKSDETGIVAWAICEDDYLWHVADRSGTFSPSVWADKVIDLFYQFRPIARDVEIVAEVNQGGDLVESNLRTRARDRGTVIKYNSTFSTVSKMYRVEACSMDVAIHKLRMVENTENKAFVKQLMGCEHMILNGKSPDRVDAAIFASNKLLPAKRKSMTILAA